MGSLIKLPLAFFLPRGRFLNTDCFLDKSDAVGALSMLSSDTADELELRRPVYSDTELDSTPLSQAAMF